MRATGITALLILLCSFQLRSPSPLPREKVYLHLDRYLYVTGDRLWYKAYVMDEGSQKYFSDSKVLYLALYNSEKKKVAQQILKLDMGQAHGDIFISDTLGSGVYILTAYTGWMRNFGASGFYRKQFMVFNRFETPGDRPCPERSNEVLSDLQDSIGKLHNNTAYANILSNQINYGTRQMVDIDILVTHDSVPVSAIFSVSAARVPPVEMIDHHTINEFFDKLNSGSREGIAKADHSIPREKKGLLMKGKLAWKDDGEPVADKRLLMAIPDSVPVFDYCHTDESGIFCFVLDKDFSSNQLYFQFEDRSIAADSVVIRWENIYTDSIYLPDNLYSLPEIDHDYLLSQRKRIAIGHAYGIDQPITMDSKTDPEGIHHPFYGTPAEVIYPAAYLPLPNLKEIARELLTTTRFTGQQGRYSLDIFNPLTRKYMPQSFILLDGVPVYDLDRVAKLGSSKLERIEIQNTTRVYGDMVFEGLVALYTRGRMIHTMDLSGTHMVYAIPKFNKPSTPLMPDYQNDDEKNKRIPDFRDLLYWGPMNRTGKDGKARLEFYTSDETGLFRITVEGITLDGVPFTGTLDINVVTDE